MEFKDFSLPKDFLTFSRVTELVKYYLNSLKISKFFMEYFSLRAKHPQNYMLL